jgi:hypothetical protein
MSFAVLRAALPVLALLACELAAAADPPWAACAAANRQAAAELTQALELGLKRHVLNPVLVTRLQTLAAQSGKLRDAAARKPRTLNECEQIAGTLASERARLDAMVGAVPVTAASTARSVAEPAVVSGLPPTPAECRDQQARAYNEIAQTHARLISGRIPDNKTAALQAVSERLTQLHALITKPRAAGWDCEQVHQSLERVRAELDKLAR